MSNRRSFRCAFYAACLAAAMAIPAFGQQHTNAGAGSNQERAKESQDVNPPFKTSTLITLMATILCGGLGGAVFTWRININRDKAARALQQADALTNRKREFLTFLRQWREEIASATPLGSEPVVLNAYRPKRSQFIAMAGAVTDIAPVGDGFQKLIDAVSNAEAVASPLTFNQADRGKAHILSALDELITFVCAW
jgi:hypothetical protein